MQRMSEDGNYRRGNELVRIGADKMNYYHAEVINLSLNIEKVSCYML